MCITQLKNDKTEWDEQINALLEDLHTSFWDHEIRRRKEFAAFAKSKERLAIAHAKWKVKPHLEESHDVRDDILRKKAQSWKAVWEQAFCQGLARAKKKKRIFSGISTAQVVRECKQRLKGRVRRVIDHAIQEAVEALLRMQQETYEEEESPKMQQERSEEEKEVGKCNWEIVQDKQADEGRQGILASENGIEERGALKGSELRKSTGVSVFDAIALFHRLLTIHSSFSSIAAVLRTVCR
ncbi:hypothetical protein C0995_010885 [Termitomyces sp. Mi166|nr:hypothetical protein C0995_010885 [Termitomyces sp. Mi166\